MKKLERTALLEVPVEVAYEVIVDVLQYPAFLPGCEDVQVRETHTQGLIAEVSVAGKGLKESFVTANVHQPGERVVMQLQEGPFEHLRGEWLLTPLGEAGCKVHLTIEYAPKSVVARVLSGLADRVANRMVDAFSDRIIAQHAVSRQSCQ